MMLHMLHDAWSAEAGRVGPKKTDATYATSVGVAHVACRFGGPVGGRRKIRVAHVACRIGGFVGSRGKKRKSHVAHVACRIGGFVGLRRQCPGLM